MPSQCRLGTPLLWWLWCWERLLCCLFIEISGWAGWEFKLGGTGRQHIKWMSHSARLDSEPKFRRVTGSTLKRCNGLWWEVHFIVCSYLVHTCMPIGISWFRKLAVVSTYLGYRMLGCTEFAKAMNRPCYFLFNFPIMQAYQIGTATQNCTSFMFWKPGYVFNCYVCL